MDGEEFIILRRSIDQTTWPGLRFLMTANGETFFLWPRIPSALMKFICEYLVDWYVGQQCCGHLGNMLAHGRHKIGNKVRWDYASAKKLTDLFLIDIPCEFPMWGWAERGAGVQDLGSDSVSYQLFGPAAQQPDGALDVAGFHLRWLQEPAIHCAPVFWFRPHVVCWQYSCLLSAEHAVSATMIF